MLMNQFRKRLKRFLENPESTPYAIIENILIRFDFEQLSIQGSHKKFGHPGLKYRLIFPIHHHDTKKVYKKIAADTLKKYFDV